MRQSSATRTYRTRNDCAKRASEISTGEVIVPRRRAALRADVYRCVGAVHAGRVCAHKVALSACVMALLKLWERDGALVKIQFVDGCAGIKKNYIFEIYSFIFYTISKNAYAKYMLFFV